MANVHVEGTQLHVETDCLKATIAVSESPPGVSYSEASRTTNPVNEHKARGAIMDDAEMRRQLEQHHLASFGWALSCCGRDVTQAEDVLQTVYLKVLDGRAWYGGHAAFKTWLFAVIRNTAADERRRHWLRTLKLAAYGRDYEGAAHEEPIAANLERLEMRTQFQHALAALARRQQEVLHLVFYQDLSIEGAAAVMGVSVGSARTHYERGKQRLREWLKETEISDETRLGRKPVPSVLS